MTCETCKYWKKEYRNQFRALCLNPKEQRIKRKFNECCNNYEAAPVENMQMQSQTRG